MKLCINCERLLPLADFYARGANRAGHASYCKRCYGERKAVRRDAKRAGATVAWRQADPLNLASAAWIRTS